MKTLITLALCLTSLSAYADINESNTSAPAQNSASESSSFKTIGVTLGTPAALNLTFGYWNKGAFPWMVQISGMDFGSVRGIQGEFGYAFDEEGHFKQYLAVAVAAAHLEEVSNTFNNEYHTFFGVGPVYGFNLSGFSLEAGLVFGSYHDHYRDTGDTYAGSPTQAVLQLGYTYMWE